jgi:uncharacterized protein (DUF427 family)
MSTGEKIPDASHPITVTPTSGRVVVSVDGEVIASSTSSLTLQEASYPPVQYVPLADIDPSLLARTETTTYCPYKGDAAYYSVSTADGTVVDAGWTYDEPYDAVAEIAGHVAFYPSKVAIDVS